MVAYGLLYSRMKIKLKIIMAFGVILMGWVNCDVESKYWEIWGNMMRNELIDEKREKVIIYWWKVCEYELVWDGMIK